jgi:hypothetical protein
MKKIGIFIFLLLPIFECLSQTIQNKSALLVYNTTYKEFPLKLPESNEETIASELQKLGFNVTLQSNITNDNFKTQIRQFISKLAENKGVGLFYYFGHSIQIDDEGFLIPVDAKIKNEKDIELEAVNVRTILNNFDSIHNDLNIIIFDVYPKIPFQSRFKERRVSNLSMLRAPKNTIIVFTFGPSSCGCDYEIIRGLYPQEFIKALHIPDLNINDFLKTVRRNVYQISNNNKYLGITHLSNLIFILIKQKNNYHKL